MSKKSPRSTRLKPRRSPARKKPETLYSANDLERETGIPANWWNQAVERGDLRPYAKRRGRAFYRLSEAQAVARGQIDRTFDDAEAGEPMAVRDCTIAANVLIAGGQPLPSRLAKFITSRTKLDHAPPVPRDRDLAITYLAHCFYEQGDRHLRPFKRAEKAIRQQIDEAIDWYCKIKPLHQELERRAEQNRLAGAKTPNPADLPLIQQCSDLMWKGPRDPVSVWAIDRHERGLPKKYIGWSQVNSIYKANKRYIATRGTATTPTASAPASILDALRRVPSLNHVGRKPKRKPTGRKR